MFRPRIAVTTGDPAGIGPEIVARAAAVLRPRIERGEFALLIIGSLATHRAIIAELGLDDGSPAIGPDRLTDESIGLAFHDVDRGGDRVPVGRSTADGGRVAYDAIAESVRLAMDGTVDAICTGPISKEALNFAGHHYSGHTELLAES